MRRAAKWISGLVGACIVICLLGLAVLATTGGQRLALRIAEYAMASPAGGVAFGKLEGSLFSEARLDHITLEDKDGAWLHVSDVAFSWSPLALIGGRVEVAYLTVAVIDLVRLPQSSPDTPSNSSSAPGTALLPLAAQRLEIGEIILREATGVPARFRVTGQANLVDTERGLSGLLDVDRLDAPGGQLRARLSYRPDERTLHVVATASEPANGLVSNLLEMPGAQPLDFSFTGNGPLDSWRAQWSMAASGQPFVAGTVRIDREGEQHRLDTRFEGYLEPILPSTLSAILSGKTAGHVAGVWTGLGRFDAERVSITSDALHVMASGGVEPERRYLSGRLDARLARGDGERIVLPLTGAPISLSGLNAQLVLPDTTGPRQIEASINAEDVSGEWGGFEQLKVTGRGIQKNPTSGKLALEQLGVQAAAHGVKLTSPGLSEVVGTSPEFLMTGTLSSNDGVRIDALRALTAAGVLKARGTFTQGVLTGRAEVTAPDLSMLSELAGQSLGGKLVLNSDVSFTPGTGAFLVTLDAAGGDLTTGDQRLDQLLSGTTILSGHMEGATPQTLVIKELRLAATGLNADVSGRMDNTSVDIDADAQLSDLAAIDPALTGEALLTAQVQGPRENFAARISLEGRQVMLHGQPVVSPSATFNGRGSFPPDSGAQTDVGRGTLTGTLEIAAEIAQRVLKGHAGLSLAEDGSATIEDLAISFGEISANGSLRTTVSGFPVGRFVLDAPSLVDLSLLTGRQVAGAVTAELTFSGTSGSPSIALQARAGRVQFGDMRLRGFEVRGTVQDYLTALRANGELRLQEFATEGLTVRDVRLGAQDANGMVRLTGALNVNGAQIDTSGMLAQRGEAIDLELTEARLNKDGHAVRLMAPARLSSSAGNVSIERLALTTGNGSVTLSGDAGTDKLALDIVLNALPVDIANAFADDLGLEGFLDGRIAVRGTPSSPDANAQIAWRNATLAALRAQHLPAHTIELKGRLAGDVASGIVEVRGPDQLLITIDGSATTDAGGTLKARITGDLPLAAGNGALAARGAQLGGRASLMADVSGTVASPMVAGTLRFAGVTVDDPATGLKLRRGNGLARFTQSQITIETFEAASEQGGTLSASGEILSNDTRPPDIRLALGLSGFRFDDRQLMSGEVDGTVDVRGTPSDLGAGGTIHIRRLDITVPNQLPRSITELDLKHVNAPDHIRQRKPAGADGERAGDMRIALNVHVAAANRIFVRGRGLDAQLGGDLRLTGTAAQPVAVGGFAMERGRLSILGRQLDFKRGNIQFNGSLEPLLDMEASAAAGDVTVIISVTGSAARPTIRFSSMPELPEDEVVARFLFNKELAGLTPLQLAQLASEIDKIGGLSSGPGMLDQLKSSVGIDVLDVGTDETGAATVSAGRYLDEKTYIGVRGSTSMDSSRIVIDHELTKSLKARGEVGADNSKIGIGVEWDY